MTFADDAPYHAHIYHSPGRRDAAEALQARFRAELGEAALFVGQLSSGPVGPHPLPQFEIHFLKRSLPEVLPWIQASGLRALVHPLTTDDLADHTALATWIGEPLALDLSVLDPPGVNQGLGRFGKTDF